MYRFHLFGKISKLKINKSLLKINKKLAILYTAGIFLSVATGLPVYINSNFIENFTSTRYVGLFFLSANIITLFVMFFFPRLIRLIGNLLSAKLMILLSISSLIVLMISSIPIFLFLFFILMWIGFNLVWVNMDIFVESFTSNLNTGKIRAIYFSFMNLGWIISPVLASRLVISDNYYNLVYLASAIVFLAFYLIIVFNETKIHIKVDYDRFSVKKIILDFWQNMNLRGIYFISFFLNLFFSSAVVFIPIYLHTNLGFDWSTLGIIFSVMLIPFILIEIPAGIIADKYIGEKEMTFVGLAILTIALLLFFFVKSSNPFIWGAILFFSRIGAALIESMRESRFFKIVDAENISHINFLRTSYPVGYLIGSTLGIFILSFYEIQYLFIFLAVLFLFSFYFVYIIKDSK